MNGVEYPPRARNVVTVFKHKSGVLADAFLLETTFRDRGGCPATFTITITLFRFYL